MPYLRLDDRWIEVPDGLEPAEGELIYEEPEDEDVTPLATAIATGLLLWAWDLDVARYTLMAEGAPIAILSRVGQAAYSQEAIRASTAATDFMAAFVSDGTLPPDQWLQLMRQEIKEEYIRQYILGRGGVHQMTARDYGSIGGMLKEQYHPHLINFYEQIKAGELSEAQIRARAAMYVRSGREAFERGKARAAMAAGYTEVYWELDPAAENCPDCINFDAMGWQKIGDNPYGGCFPSSGCTQCLTNCMCSLRYR